MTTQTDISTLEDIESNPVSFDESEYNDLALSELNTIANTIQELYQVAAVAHIRIGQELTKAKQLLRHGQFRSWCKAKTGLDDSTITRAMQAADKFGDLDDEIIAAFDVQTLGLLAANTTKPDLISWAVNRVTAGQTVTFKEVYIRQRAPLRILERFEQGDISLNAAYGLCQVLKAVDWPVQDKVLAHDVINVKVIDWLAKQYDKHGKTEVGIETAWMDIFAHHSGHLVYTMPNNVERQVRLSEVGEADISLYTEWRKYGHIIERRKMTKDYIVQDVPAETNVRGGLIINGLGQHRKVKYSVWVELEEDGE